MMSTNYTVKPLYLQIDELLQCTTIVDPLRHCAFKLPSHVRDASSADEKVYEPQVISIGPYHHDKDHLKAMEMYKLLFLKMLLRRRKEGSVERYVAALKANEKKVRDFYAGSLGIEEDPFLKMMLLDGCFIVELIRMSHIDYEKRDENNYFHLPPFISMRVMRDLLLFENQLPLFVLSNLFDMTAMPNDPINEGFVSMAASFFSDIGPVFRTRSGPFPHPENMKHLLELLHRSWVPSTATAPAMVSPGVGTVAVTVNTSNRSISRRGREHKVWKTIPPASTVYLGGIWFRKIEDDDNWLFDIKFDDRSKVMSIQTLVIDGDTESIFRNLVSFEQGDKGMLPKLVTDYLTFMCCLIHTEEDVRLLCRRGVIDNQLGGSDQVVVDMFKRLRTTVLFTGDGFSYADIFLKVNSRFSSGWRRSMVTFGKDYFNMKPETFFTLYISFVALIVAVVQTIVGFKSIQPTASKAD